MNMKHTHADAYTDIRFQLRWDSEHARHTDCYFGQQINLWRDFFPNPVAEWIMNQSVGNRSEFTFEPGTVIPGNDSKQRFSLRRDQFNRDLLPGLPAAPHFGRFYPRGLLSGVTNVFKENITPFRCVGVDEHTVQVDFNHPLAGKALRLDMEIRDVREKISDTGGSCKDWMEVVTDGPGIQARWNGKATDFFSDDPFVRPDESRDTIFYEQPRMVQHIDDTAIAGISWYYGQHLTPDMKVLDLMSSWQSHIPAEIPLKQLTGLGLNEAELRENPALTDYRVHDLNETPELPFDDNSFDAAVCTVSVEYLTKPFAVFRELHRVLRPGGLLLVSFSNRWFPPKAIQIWPKLHEFERMGLVMEYFLESGQFTDLATWSLRGMPRPEHDKYYWELMFSDPVYIVRGQNQ